MHHESHIYLGESMRPKRLTLIGLAGLAVVALALVAFAVARPTGYKTAGAYTPPTLFPQTQPANRVLLEVIGDSYTGGSQMGGLNGKGWAYLVAAGLPNAALDVVAQGGSGYVTKGPTYKQTLPEFYAANGKPGQGVVVVFAGLNDSAQDPAAVGKAAGAFYAQLKKASPKASLIVVGPAWPGVKPMPDNVSAVRDAIKAAASTAGAQFVDPIADGWFAGPDARLIGSDTTHPADEGHKYMADKLAPVIGSAVQKAAG